MATVEQFIERKRAEIIARWLEEAGQAAAARGLSVPELRHLLPRFLDTLGTRVDPAVEERRRKSLEGHVASRLRHGFALDAMIAELDLLGREIAASWADAGAEAPDASDVARLYGQLAEAGSQAAGLFVEHLLRDEQAAKRMLRLMQLAADEALELPDGGLPGDALGEMLSYLVEGMALDAAGLVVRDRGTEALRSVACIGVPPRSAAEFGAALAEAPFEEPGEHADLALSVIATTSLRPTEPLRQCGVEAILAVRFAAHGRLSGLLWVGTRDRRAFGPRELRRLETFGQQLSIHLEHARLFADLQDKVADLAEERQVREAFVSTLAHDLRGPLSAAKLATDLLARAPGAHGPVAVRIQRNLERVDRMVRDLLDANRLHAGEPLPLELSDCDLGAIAAEVVEGVRSLQGGRVVLDAEPGVRGRWDADELRRTLWNLVSNAVKFGAPGAPVTVRVRHAGPDASVSVHNLGSYIAPEVRERLFQPFARVDVGERPRRTGWGLGLTLVKGAVEAHGGRVWIESDPRAGTTFSFALPAEAHPAHRGGEAHP